MSQMLSQKSEVEEIDAKDISSFLNKPPAPLVATVPEAAFVVAGCDSDEDQKSNGNGLLSQKSFLKNKWSALPSSSDDEQEDDGRRSGKRPCPDVRMPSSTRVNDLSHEASEPAYEDDEFFA